MGFGWGHLGLSLLRFQAAFGICSLKVLLDIFQAAIVIENAA
ncbi:hypothetical protein [Kingella negevensis]|nr:hypothetical protein [Kingella negevensis]MDK4688211.1 hypothetical protein [Kingella negevensis]WII91832.1 hypothetical protein QEO93_04425 [Kingella negevensis]WII93250.1 hypothetical protein QEO94_11645 [Kingella negevensis]